MATEALDWASPTPSDTDEADGSQAYNMGIEFGLTEDLPIPGVQWRVPDSVSNPQGGPHAISLWNQDTGVRLRYQEITPTPGGYQEFDFTTDGPYPGVQGVTYVVGVYTNHYVFTSGNPTGTESPSGAVVAGGGLLVPYNSGAATAPIPDVPSSNAFYVSPIVDLGEGPPEEHTTTGTARLTASATAATTTSRTTSATATMAATAAASISTNRITSGSAPISALASAAVATARVIAASARLTVSAAAAAASARITSGSARVLVSASSYAPPAAAGPWLVTRARDMPIVTRSRRA